MFRNLGLRHQKAPGPGTSKIAKNLCTDDRPSFLFTHSLGWQTLQFLCCWLQPPGFVATPSQELRHQELHVLYMYIIYIRIYIYNSVSYKERTANQVSYTIQENHYDWERVVEPVHGFIPGTSPKNGMLWYFKNLWVHLSRICGHLCLKFCPILMNKLLFLINPCSHIISPFRE